MNNRNGALDVLRALAIIMVVNCHAVSTLITDGTLSVLQLGGKGVDLFFVLSGWLLGSQLCIELKQTGKIEVVRFWTRRWLRTLPAYFAVLALTLLQQLLLKPQPIFDWRYFFFLQNYPPTMPYFGVSWSLCVEEHFYLLVAPCMLLGYYNRPSRWILLILLLVPTVCRFMGWYTELIETHVRYDQCAAGVMLAVVSVFAPSLWARVARLAWPIAGFGLALAGINILRRMQVLDGADFDSLVWTFIFGSMVLLAVTSLKDTIWSQARWIRYLANRAYSVYLLHIEGLAIVKKLPELPFPVALALTWIISLALSELLYRFLERPIMNAREWFSWSRSLRQLEPKQAPPETIISQR